MDCSSERSPAHIIALTDISFESSGCNMWSSELSYLAKIVETVVYM